MAYASGSDSVPQSQCKTSIVAAIDLGTTYSGYAFSFRDDFNRDPTRISASNWTAGTRALVSLKTPSCILLNEKKEFVAFGYEAEERYCDLAMDEEHEEYHYFRRFKMLFSEAQASGLRGDIMLEDDFRKKVRALTIFSMSIKYLMDHFIKSLEYRLGDSINMKEEITWVLTVPAIWNDAAKQFMRESAIAAGIKSQHLIIALEPEAVSLYFMMFPVDELNMSNTDRRGGNPSFVLPNGTKYIILNAGGGTVDITIHEVVNQNTLKELHSASGGAWGCVKVEEAFKQMIISIIGEDVYEEYVINYNEDLEGIFREFEENKNRNVSSKDITVRLPISMYSLYEEMKEKEFGEAVKEYKPLKGRVYLIEDRLKVDSELLKGLFDESINNTVKHAKALLDEKSSAGTSTIVLVGGFAKSKFLQEAIRSNFPNQRLVIPEQPELTVLKGAVLFGHYPLTIVSRKIIAKCSYGVRVYRDFQAGVDPSNMKTTVGARVKCKDVFAVHVKKGQELKVNEPQSRQRYTPFDADQLSLVFDIYKSTEENPMYVTDHSCSYLGQLEVEVPNLSGSKERGVFVNMIFGETEIIVEAREERDQTKMTRAKFDFSQ